MEIAFIIQALQSGGAEKQLLLLARCLCERGWKATIFTLSDRAAHPRIKLLIGEAEKAGVKLPRASHSKLGAPMQVAAALRKLASAGTCVFWSWGSRADLIAKLVAMVSPQAVLICSLRDADRERIRRFRVIERFSNGRVAKYVSNSWLNCELLSEFVPAVLPRSRVLYNALSEDELCQSSAALPYQVQSLKVLLLGNFRPHKKGYDLVVELAIRHKALRLPISLEIAGREDEPNWLNSRIRAHGLAGYLDYRGEVSDPYEFLRTGDVFLMMSRVEGTPNALLEAMNLGLPCISSKIGDVARFMTDGVHGRIIEIGDIDGVLSILRGFLADWPAARAMGEAGQKLCRNLFTPARLAQTAELILAELGVKAGDPGAKLESSQTSKLSGANAGG
jgi:glycosyltransferase involved in cell wall biosynthesis